MGKSPQKGKESAGKEEVPEVSPSKDKNNVRSESTSTTQNNTTQKASSEDAALGMTSSNEDNTNSSDTPSSSTCSSSVTEKSQGENSGSTARSQEEYDSQRPLTPETSETEDEESTSIQDSNENKSGSEGNSNKEEVLSPVTEENLTNPALWPSLTPLKNSEVPVIPERRRTMSYSDVVTTPVKEEEDEGLKEDSEVFTDSSSLTSGYTLLGNITFQRRKLTDFDSTSDGSNKSNEKPEPSTPKETGEDSEGRENIFDNENVNELVTSSTSDVTLSVPSKSETDDASKEIATNQTKHEENAPIKIDVVSATSSGTPARGTPKTEINLQEIKTAKNSSKDKGTPEPSTSKAAVASPKTRSNIPVSRSSMTRLSITDFGISSHSRQCTSYPTVSNPGSGAKVKLVESASVNVGSPKGKTSATKKESAKTNTPGTTSKESQKSNSTQAKKSPKTNTSSKNNESSKDNAGKKKSPKGNVSDKNKSPKPETPGNKKSPKVNPPANKKSPEVNPPAHVESPKSSTSATRQSLESNNALATKCSPKKSPGKKLNSRQRKSIAEADLKKLTDQNTKANENIPASESPDPIDVTQDNVMPRRVSPTENFRPDDKPAESADSDDDDEVKIPKIPAVEILQKAFGYASALIKASLDDNKDKSSMLPEASVSVYEQKIPKKSYVDLFDPGFISQSVHHVIDIIRSKVFRENGFPMTDEFTFNFHGVLVTLKYRYTYESEPDGKPGGYVITPIIGRIRRPTIHQPYDYTPIALALDVWVQGSNGAECFKTTYLGFENCDESTHMHFPDISLKYQDKKMDRRVEKYLVPDRTGESQVLRIHLKGQLRARPYILRVGVHQGVGVHRMEATPQDGKPKKKTKSNSTPQPAKSLRENSKKPKK